MNNRHIEVLNEYLSNVKVLNNNLYNLHFNVVGDTFFPLHMQFQGYYEKMAEIYDQVAERIKALASYPITHLTEYERISTIKSRESKDYPVSEAIHITMNDFMILLEIGRNSISYFDSINDPISAGIIGDVNYYLEKQLWMLRANLQ